MPEYDGLPLNTPTKVREDSNSEVWATRTPNGGTVETRLIGVAAQADANKQSLNAKADQALTANATFLALAAPTNAQVLAQTKLLTRETNVLIRLLLNQLDDISNT